FPETFSFEVTPNFKILVQLYGIWMKEPPKLSTLGKYLQCKNSSSCIFSKLQYQNPNTRDIEESTLQTSRVHRNLFLRFAKHQMETGHDTRFGCERVGLFLSQNGQLHHRGETLRVSHSGHQTQRHFRLEQTMVRSRWEQFKNL
ncbi:unnamed protein product, partial [Tenebrio molitor]